MYRVSDHQWAAFSIFDIDCKQRSPVTIAIGGFRRHPSGLLEFLMCQIIYLAPGLRLEILTCMIITFGVSDLVCNVQICGYADEAPSLPEVYLS